MSRRALTTVVGLGAAAGGYYLYNAGGSPKVAEKQFEKDVAKLTHNKSGEAQKVGEEYASAAGKKLDNAYADAKNTADKYGKDAKNTADKYAKDAQKTYEQGKAEASSKIRDIRAETGKAIDQFDAAVEKKATEAKSGISGWFGGK